MERNRDDPKEMEWITTYSYIHCWNSIGAAIGRAKNYAYRHVFKCFSCLMNTT